VSDPRISPLAPEDAESLAEVARLFAEYAEWLSGFVVHTTIHDELDTLPAPFAAPGGVLLVGRDDEGAICGCAGVKRLSDSAAEIKRLFVREECRGAGMGRALFSAALDAACELGYSEAFVSTIPSHMAAANAMYERIGFAPAHRFEDHTHAEVDIRYLRLDLSKWCKKDALPAGTSSGVALADDFEADKPFGRLGEALDRLD
jgi:putative acetyltransferase